MEEDGTGFSHKPLAGKPFNSKSQNSLNSFTLFSGAGPMTGHAAGNDGLPGDPVGADYNEMQRHFFDQFAAYLRQMKHKLRINDIEAASLVVCMAVEEIVHSLKAFDALLPEKRVVAALAEMVYRYLFKASDEEAAPACSADPGAA